MKKKLNLILNKCKSLSRQLTRSSSNSGTSACTSRSKSSSSRDQELIWGEKIVEEERQHIVFVGSTKRRYVISSKHLNHPLLSALMEKERSKQNAAGDLSILLVKCEVVMFDHLLWMLDNAEPELTSDSYQELVELYA
ncbi:hypothetical protein Vadar_010279 [Vaccinium darrowii]|uniref:Uncharacterized protein n=1 Tax=Vaccinium darrowii TaxID=229202 RepID=A0ACB7X8U9_9ERIC|nr:hypothetical protein Vadar_010279 [Vaccinium darrowii]